MTKKRIIAAWQLRGRRPQPDQPYAVYNTQYGHTCLVHYRVAVPRMATGILTLRLPADLVLLIVVSLFMRPHASPSPPSNAWVVS